MTFSKWLNRTTKQIRGISPFTGSFLPGRVPVFAGGRPSMPFPHFWNYHEPLKILETYFWGVDDEVGSKKHNRYLDVPGLDHVLVTRDPLVIRTVLSATGDKDGQFDRDTRPSAGIARATGTDSLLYANGPLWRRQKKLSAPPMSRSNLFQPETFHEFEKTFRNTAIERLEILRQRQEESGESATELEMESEVEIVMLEMLVNNFFGASVSYEDLRDRYAPAIAFLIDHMVSDTVGHSIRGLRNAVLGEPEAIAKAKADFEELTDIALSGRKEGRGLWGQFKSDAGDDKLRSNIRVFLAGALEATTSFTSWTLSHLAQRPDLQEVIYQEVQDVEVYDPENLKQAVMLNRCLQETLRLTPSLYFLPRWTSQEIELDLGEERSLRIPANTHVMLDVWHSNRCEDFWGEEETGYSATAFAPERWEVLEKKGRSPKEMLHFGFGHGPRVCPGKFLGQLEVGLAVGAFVKLFTFSNVQSLIEARAAVSTKPADHLFLRITRRK